MPRKPEDKVILLTGGTGKIARRIVPLLSKFGNKVIVASRSGNYPSLRGCRGVMFDWLEQNTYWAPFKLGLDIDSVFIVAPTVWDLERMTKFIDRAISKGVERFVLLSASVFDTGDGPVMTRVASYIKSQNVEYAILQPTWFMQNFSEANHQVTIKKNNQIISATGDGKIPFVSADDIADVAFRALVDAVPHNTDHLILGPQLWSYDEVAELLSKKMGRKITHLQVTEGAFAEGLMAGGMPKDYANMLAALETHVRNDGELKMNHTILNVTGNDPRNLKSFVDDLIPLGVWDEEPEEPEELGKPGKPGKHQEDENCEDCKLCEKHKEMKVLGPIEAAIRTELLSSPSGSRQPAS